MLSRVGNGADDVASCTSSPAAVWRVPLVTVPIRLTVAPGLAYCGFIELMITETRPVAAGRAGLAWAGLASTMMAGAIIAGTAKTAGTDSIRRLTFAVSTPCTPGMLLPFAPGPCCRSEEHTSELQSLRHLVC